MSFCSCCVQHFVHAWLKSFNDPQCLLTACLAGRFFFAFVRWLSDTKNHFSLIVVGGVAAACHLSCRVHSSLSFIIIFFILLWLYCQSEQLQCFAAQSEYIEVRHTDTRTHVHCPGAPRTHKCSACGSKLYHTPFQPVPSVIGVRFACASRDTQPHRHIHYVSHICFALSFAGYRRLA